MSGKRKVCGLCKGTGKEIAPSTMTELTILHDYADAQNQQLEDAGGRAVEKAIGRLEMTVDAIARVLVDIQMQAHGVKQ